MAPRSGGALRCHALCPVLLRNCKFTLGVTSRSVSVQRRVELAPSPDEFVINPREADFFTVCVFAMRFGERLMCLVSLAFLWQQKSRRGKVFGKVNCKNIKQDCPDLDCDDPVLLPGHCCKTCPKGNYLLIQSHPPAALRFSDLELSFVFCFFLLLIQILVVLNSHLMRKQASTA